MLYHYRVTEILSVYDGDTVTLMIDKGFNTFMKVKVRLARINTPEIRTRDLDEKKRGYAARDFLRELLALYSETLILHTVKKGKYGRWIGELYSDSPSCYDDERFYSPDIEELHSVNDALVKCEHAEYKEY